MDTLLLVAIFLSAIVLVYFLLPIVARVVRGMLESGRSAEQREADRRELARRLGRPDFIAVEKLLGAPLPALLRGLYEDATELARENFGVAPGSSAPEDQIHVIAVYLPADGEALVQSESDGRRYFAFAYSGERGRLYVLDPMQEDSPVWICGLKGEQMRPVCDRFSEFMTWPRFRRDQVDAMLAAHAKPRS